MGVGNCSLFLFLCNSRMCVCVCVWWVLQHCKTESLAEISEERKKGPYVKGGRLFLNFVRI